MVEKTDTFKNGYRNARGWSFNVSDILVRYYQNMNKRFLNRKPSSKQCDRLERWIKPSNLVLTPGIRALYKCV